MIYEYSCKHINTRNLTTQIISILNEMGEEGWELITIVNEIAYFKRLKDA